jgi:hypothetical protein
MIKYRTVIKKSKVKYFENFICDKCKKELNEDDIDLQETYSIKFTGGYTSIFGDETKVSCDLCQHCLFEMIGDICKYK